MNVSKSTGGKGEDISTRYLEKNGYTIIERNHKTKWGEIDIVARAPDRTLVFVEVKTLHSGGSSSLIPEDNFSRSKKERTYRAALAYANDRSDLVNENKGWRTDLLALTINSNNVIIKHYLNV